MLINIRRQKIEPNASEAKLAAVSAFIAEHEKDPEVKEARDTKRGFLSVDDMCLKDLGINYRGRLFLGKQHPPQEMLNQIRQKQIHVIISVGFSQSPWQFLLTQNEQNRTNVRHTYSHDVEDLEAPEHFAKMQKILPIASEQLHRHLTKGENVLIHCYQGASRSATCVLWFLTQRHGFTLLEAVRHVKGKRPVILPKPGFLRLCLSC
jgi:protein-tyrosine phosphatase